MFIDTSERSLNFQFLCYDSVIMKNKIIWRLEVFLDSVKLLFANHLFFYHGFP